MFLWNSKLLYFLQLQSLSDSAEKFVDIRLQHLQFFSDVSQQLVTKQGSYALLLTVEEEEEK